MKRSPAPDTGALHSQLHLSERPSFQKSCQSRLNQITLPGGARKIVCDDHHCSHAKDHLSMTHLMFGRTASHSTCPVVNCALTVQCTASNHVVQDWNPGQVWLTTELHTAAKIHQLDKKERAGLLSKANSEVVRLEVTERTLAPVEPVKTLHQIHTGHTHMDRHNTSMASAL